jgi:hypothetical protein
MKKYLYLWSGFLLIYLYVLFNHIFEINPSIYLLGFLFGGLVLAVYAHRKKHWSSIPFLVLHMVIEAIEFSSTGFSFGGWTLFWVLVHIAMDVVFLWDEVRRHFPQAKYILSSSILLAIGAIYLFSPKIHSASSSFMDSFHDQIELFVLGGVIGCVLSHLIPHKHKNENGH